MSATPAVVDTNVIVSGLISRHPTAAPRQIITGMLAGAFPYLLSPALLAEYLGVLTRPGLQKLHKLNKAMIGELMTQITANAMMLEPASGHAAPNTGDNHLWNLLAAHPGSTLVTGDKLLLDNPPAFADVVTPRSFVNSRLFLQTKS